MDNERLDDSILFEHLWRALARSKSLRTVTIIFQNFEEEMIDFQVRAPPLDELGMQ